MKTKSLDVSSREILLRNRETTLARLFDEMQTLRRLVRLEEMRLAGETGTVKEGGSARSSHPCWNVSAALAARLAEPGSMSEGV